MPAFPVLPMYVADMVADTQHLSNDELGAYHRLIYAMWLRRDCNLPDDDAQLARVAKVTRWVWSNRLRETMAPLFVIENGVWEHKRLKKTRSHSQKISESAHVRAKAAANARWRKNKDLAMLGANVEQCLSNAQAMLSISIDSPSENHTPPIVPPMHPEPPPAPRRKASPKPSPKRNEYPDEFDLWWKTYPATVRKASKIEAHRRWVEAMERGFTAEELQKALERYVERLDPKSFDPAKGIDFVPAPEVWLNKGRYEGFLDFDAQTRVQKARRDSATSGVL